VLQVRTNPFNFFVSKILTYKPLRLKILRAIFAKPAPVKTSPAKGRGGYPLELGILPIWHMPGTASEGCLNKFFSARFPQPAVPLSA
jgi:hypothetical protein